jgi:uncharacterized protein (TIGR03437 family)
LTLFAAAAQGQAVIDGFSLDQISFTAVSTGNIPCSEYGQAGFAVRETPRLFQFVQVTAQLAGSTTSPAWIVQNLPVTGQGNAISTGVSLTPLGVTRGNCITGTKVNYTITVTDTPVTATPSFTGAISAIVGQLTDNAEGVIDANATAGTLDAPILGVPSSASPERRVLPAGAPPDNGDINVTEYTRDGMGNVTQNKNECAPAAVANSMHWLQGEGSAGLGLDTPAQSVVKLESDMNWISTKGASPTNIVAGKMAFAQRPEHPINLNVVYQGASANTGLGGSVTQGSNTSTRDGGDAPPTLDFIQQQMASGADVELQVEWLGTDANGNVKVTGAHMLAVSGMLTGPDGNALLTNDARYQNGQTSGLRTNHVSGVGTTTDSNGNTYLTLSGLHANRVVAVYSESVKPTNFCFVPLETSGSLAVYNVTPGSSVGAESLQGAAGVAGGLTAVPGSPFTTGPSTVAVTTVLGRFAYAASFGGNNIYAFTINPTTGALTPISGSPFAAGSGPFGLTSDLSGRFLYSANYSSSNISAFAIDPTTGALTAVPGSPFSASGPASLAISGRVLFVANYDGGNLGAYLIDNVTGALTPVSGSPFTAGASPNWVAVHPNGKFVYVVNNNGSNVSAYSVGANGALTQIPGSPFAAGTEPDVIAILPRGNFAYVSNYASGNISAYSINETTGALTPIPGSPFAAASGAFSVASDPAGQYLYAGNQGGSSSVSAYSINSTTGALTPISGAPFSISGGPARLSLASVGPWVSTFPVPVLKQLSPSTAAPGSGPITLTIYGSNFSPGATARWNGSPRTTVMISATQLNVALSGADLATAGTAPVTVSNLTPGGGTSSALPFAINAAAAPPVVPSATGTVNAASFQPGMALVPGSIAAVFGTSLGSGTTNNSGLPLPTTLGGSSVLFNGTTPAPLFFTSSGQINMQVPWEVEGPERTWATFTTSAGTSAPSTVTLAAFAPGVFTINAAGQGAIQISSSGAFAAPVGSVPGANAAPVAKGDYLTIYCTGLGDVTNQPATGAPAPGGPNLAATLTTPVVTIGGANATVSFSGLAPGFVGLYQVNVQVPAGAPSGNTVTLQLSIGGINASPVTIAVQ